MQENHTLVDFEQEIGVDNWYIVNDDVMGGVSRSSLDLNDNGYVSFKGEVSLENYGGFASVRHTFSKKELQGYSRAVLRIKGDGKTYQFRVKSSRYERHSYIFEFQTSGAWETIEIPLREMYPSFRGRRLSIPNFPAEQVQEITFLIGNKKEESFQLDIASVLLAP